MNFFTTISVLLMSRSVMADYFWKDYVDDVPDDAFIAGTDKDERDIYIGQTFFIEKNSLLPSTITIDDKYAYSDLEEPLKSENATKILCSTDQKDLIWASTTSETMKDLKKCNRLIGGYLNNGTIVFIGRTEFDRHTYVGKVYHSEGRNLNGLYIYRGPGDGYFKTDFELLTSGCENEINKSNVTPVLEKVFRN